MPHLIAYAWIVTAVVTIALAAGRRVPILNAFGWIHSRPGFYFSAAVLAVVSGLAVLQLASEALLLGQEPIVWAALIALIYAWVCVGQQLRKSTDSCPDCPRVSERPYWDEHLSDPSPCPEQ